MLGELPTRQQIHNTAGVEHLRQPIDRHGSGLLLFAVSAAVNSHEVPL